MGGRVLPGISRVKPGLIGQDDQYVGIQQVGDQSTERVVVAELDFIVDDGVVLVDDRNDTQAQQRQQRGASVEIPLAIGKVRVGQQHLGAVNALLAQLRFVDLSQTHLTDCCRGLQLWMPFGRTAQPSRFIPSAMAPLETMTISRSWAARAAI